MGGRAVRLSGIPMMTFRTVLLLSAISATALAKPVSVPSPKPVPINPGKVKLTGADARALTAGLKLAGIAPKKTGETSVYAVTQLSCTSTDGSVTEDGLGTTSCQGAAGKSMPAAESALLDEAVTKALGGKGLTSDDHMSKSTITVASITCTIGSDTKAPKTADRFSCDAVLH